MSLRVTHPQLGRLAWIMLAASIACGAACCDAATVYGDAVYSSVLSTIPNITFVNSTPSMGDDTSVYFSSFGWPANRGLQQQDYISVPVAVMAICMAVQPNGAYNTTSTVPSMTDIANLLLGTLVGNGSTWLRTNWTSTKRVTKVYWATATTGPLLNALGVWAGSPFGASTTTLPAKVNTSLVSILPTDVDVLAALAADPNAVAFLPQIAAVQAQMTCLTLTRKAGAVVAPQVASSWVSVITFNTTTLLATCPSTGSCYPIMGLLVAHVRKESSMKVICNSSTSAMPAVYNFTSATSAIVGPLIRWSMQLPPTAVTYLTLQRMTALACMPETTVLQVVGSNLTTTPLNDWAYKYFFASNGTGFLNYTATSAADALVAVEAGVADLAAGPALNASDRAAYPTLHSFPTLTTGIAVVLNLGLATTLALPRCSITSIFNGTITTWSEKSIQNANPTILMPNVPIKVALRSDASPVTDVFMAGLRALDMECFGTTSIPPTAVLPNYPNATLLQSNDAVANFMSALYTVTWVASEYANTKGLNQAAIQASDSTTSTTIKIAQSLVGGTLDPVTSDYTMNGVNNYPFVLFSSLIVPLSTWGSCDRYNALVDFFFWVETLSASTTQFYTLPSDARSGCVAFLTTNAMCNGQLLFPPPPPPLPWWPFFLAGMIVLIGIVSAARWRYWQVVYGVRPTDPMKPIAVMFVGVKNQAAVAESGEMNVSAVCRRVAETTRRMVRKHGCYEARRVDAWTTMIVAKTAQAAVACAEDIVVALSVDVQWADEVMTHPMPLQPQIHVSDRKSAVSGRSDRSAKSRGTHSRQTQSQAHTPSQRNQTTSHTHKTGSSGTLLTLQQCIPQIYAGVHWAHVMIDDSHGDVVSYYGAGVGTAGSVADMAVDGQVVVSRQVVDELTAHADEDDMCEDYTFNLLTASTKEVTALSLSTPRFPEWLLERTAVRRKSLEEKGADGAGNTIAAAMASADGTLGKRRIAVVSLLMRDMTTDGVEGRADAVRDTLETLHEIVKAHRGEILSIVDGIVTVTIGASGPVAMAAVRAAQIASDASEICDAAGVHSGTTLVGNAMGGKPATVGRIVTGAALMRQVAARAKVPIVASESVHADLSSRFQLVTVDLIAAPWDVKKNIRCYGVAEERADNGEEWLYEMRDGFAPFERRLEEILHNKAPTAEPSSPNEPSLANLFLERHSAYLSLSNDLCTSLQAARDGEGIAGHLVRRLIAVSTFAVVGNDARYTA